MYKYNVNKMILKRKITKKKKQKQLHILNRFTVDQVRSLDSIAYLA